MFDDGPSLSSVSNINNFSIRQFIKRTLIRLINNSPGTYFVTSRHSMEDLVQMGFVKGKLAQLPFFTKPSIYSTELREKHGCSKKDCLIFAGGRLIDQKGFDLLITAMSMVSAPINYARKLVIVGSGSAETKLKHLTKSLSISDYVDFLPWAEADLFASYIYSCDIFVAPARLDHFPTTVIAAMQAGIPVVATDGVGSAVEFIESGRNGIIVPSESPEALASALEQLINDPTLREVLGSAAKVTMSEWPVERGARLVVDAARKALIQCAD
jgi:glycosyltransferase involved in cell wall biosynthesis